MFESNADFEIDETLFQDVSISQLNDPHRSKISRGAFKRPKIPENAKNLLDKIDGVGKSGNARKLQRKSPSFEKLVVQRKFPGPAGLLPDRRNLENFETPNETEDKHEIEICSQDSSRGFDDEAWSTMRVDLRRLGESLRKYNVDWVKRKGQRRRLINQKAPFLAAAIKSVKCTNTKMPMFILSDETGDIPATIVYDLYERYADRLTVGSVIVLRQFGVLTTNGGSKHHITITANNLVTIYSVDKTNDANVVEKNKVTIVSVRDVATDDLLDDIECNDEAKFSARDRRDSSNDDSDFRLKFSRTVGIRDNVNNHSCNDGVTKMHTNQACLSKHTENVSIWGGNGEDVFDDLNFDDFSEEFCEVASKRDDVKCVENEVVGGIHETLDDLDGCERSGTNENRRCDATVRFKFKKYDCHRTAVLDSIGLLNTSESHERNYNRQECVSVFCDNVVAKSVDVSQGKNVRNKSENQELPMSKRKKLACKDKLNAFKFRPKEVEAVDGIEKCARVCDLKLDTKEERTRQMIDCSQISVISSGNNDCDVLKDVFRDLDESVLFDDF